MSDRIHPIGCTCRACCDPGHRRRTWALMLLLNVAGLAGAGLLVAAAVDILRARGLL